MPYYQDLTAGGQRREQQSLRYRTAAQPSAAPVPRSKPRTRIPVGIQRAEGTTIGSAAQPRSVTTSGPQPAPQVPNVGDIGYQPVQFEDPALAQIRAIAARSRSEATARALGKKKEAAIQFGEGPEGEKNPFSILSNLKRDYTRGTRSLEDALNKSNLFYSGYRGDQLSEAATDYQGRRYDATTRYQALVHDIEDALAQALLQADLMEIGAGGGGGAGGGLGGPTGWGIMTGTGEGDLRKSGIAGALIATPYDPNKNSDIEYALPGRGDDANQGGWVRDGDGWYSPVYGIRVDANGRVR